LDLKTLEILKDTYIDKELSEHFSDILYRIKISGKVSYIYLLFEHKSYIDEWVGFQLLRNMVKIWEGYRKQNKKAKKLPVIIPTVIYHGREKWKAKDLIVKLFDEIPDVKCYIPDFKSEVLDISHIPDEQIKGEILLRVHFLLQKYIFSPELFGKIHDIFEIFRALSSKNTAMEYIEVMLRYMTASVDSKRSDDLKVEIEKALKGGGDIMPTIAEKWVEEGEKKKELEICRKLIEMKLDNAQIRNATGLSIKKIQEIRMSLSENNR
jgi:predicted transposase/invertase (TIGR01784 family)